MEFEVLGPLRVREGTVTAPMSRTLLGILLCRANTRVSVDVLVDALWAGQPDPGASKKLQLHVHRLRRALVDPDRVRFEHSGYLLRVHPGSWTPTGSSRCSRRAPTRWSPVSPPGGPR